MWEMVGMFPFWHRHHPQSKARPHKPHIRRLDLHIHYSRRNHHMATATITIVLPTARTDGTALTPDQIGSTAIFDSTSATPTVPIGTVQGAGTTFTTDVLTVGVHNYSAVTTDTTGHSSAASNVATVIVPAVLANPNPPSITAVLNP